MRLHRSTFCYCDLSMFNIWRCLFALQFRDTEFKTSDALKASVEILSSSHLSRIMTLILFLSSVFAIMHLCTPSNSVILCTIKMMSNFLVEGVNCLIAAFAVDHHLSILRTREISFGVIKIKMRTSMLESIPRETFRDRASKQKFLFLFEFLPDDSIWIRLLFLECRHEFVDARNARNLPHYK